MDGPVSGGIPQSRFLPWRFINALAVVAIIILVTAVATKSPVYGDIFNAGHYSDFKWPEVIKSAGARGLPEIRSNVLLHLPNARLAVWAGVAYAVVFAAWYLIAGGGPAKPTLAILAAFKLLRRPLEPGMTQEERAAILNIAVKAIFVPLMTIWVMSNAANAMNAVGNTIANRQLPFMEWYWRHLHWAFFWCLLMVDTLWFWFGYLVEHPRLGNTIRSVEPTFLGWLVTLACYPALNIWTGQLLGWYASDQPQVLANFGNSAAAQVMMVVMGLAVIVLMGIYAWASVALGFKASNLTNRGTVSDGPYRWVRHPAYASKNAAWILSGLVPLAAALWQTPWAGLAHAGVIALSLVSWAFIYHLRALTEERHLGMDPEYRDYCSRVRWRYVPGVY